MKAFFLSIFCILPFMTSYSQIDNSNTQDSLGVSAKQWKMFYELKKLSPPPDSTGMSELDRATKATGLTYRLPIEYRINNNRSSKGSIFSYPTYPKELVRTAGNVITSTWVHEDGECVLFILCPGMAQAINKTRSEIQSNTYNRIRHALHMGRILEPTTEQQMDELKEIITYWADDKAKEYFNAQHVLSFPINEPKAVYENKYTVRYDLTMIKWGEYLTIRMALTDKGYKDIEKYIEKLKGVFWFED